jgi:uncharacterized protein YprB with RNaseH-like and TPR domain
LNLAVVDIESTGLTSDGSFLLCVGIRPLGGKSKVMGLHEFLPTAKRFDPLAIDAGLLLAVREEMERYDGWITWNGLMFDLPFIDDRLLLTGQDPLERRFARGLDIMWHARQGKSRLQSSRLDWVAKAFQVPVSKSSLDIGTWKRAEAEARMKFREGRKNYDYILEHNRLDLEVTELVYERLKSRIVNISKR